MTPQEAAQLRSLIHENICAERLHAQAGAIDHNLNELTIGCIRASQKLAALIATLVYAEDDAEEGAA